MNDKLVVIHQPDFIPYIGFFDRLLHADIYVVLDNVQYVRRNKEQWTNRDQIKARNGIKWITANVKKADNQTKINKILLSDEYDWRKKCKNILHNSYCNALWYKSVNPYIC
ncbi:MAG: WbqC family protein, partial [Lachnospiraceae bacterium]|nr:WbqC family protein [Lachnospiraceae bacterium]